MYTTIYIGLPSDVTFLCPLKQEEVLPRPADVPEDMLDDFWSSLDSILQLSALDEVFNQSNTVLEQIISPVLQQLNSWVSTFVSIGPYQYSFITHALSALQNCMSRDRSLYAP